jgi:hypothetical protein
MSQEHDICCSKPNQEKQTPMQRFKTVIKIQFISGGEVDLNLLIHFMFITDL